MTSLNTNLNTRNKNVSRMNKLEKKFYIGICTEIPKNIKIEVLKDERDIIKNKGRIIVKTTHKDGIKQIRILLIKPKHAYEIITKGYKRMPKKLIKRLAKYDLKQFKMLQTASYARIITCIHKIN